MSDKTSKADKSEEKTISLGKLGVLTFIVAVGAAVATVAISALLINIFERKQEAQEPYFRVVKIDDDTVDPEVWGKNFPVQYDMYKQTVDMQRTRYGGSEAMPRTPTEADPRAVVTQSKIDEDPRLKTMWAGYSFAVDFREERGHAYMLTDQTLTKRHQAAQQPGTCLNCHASTYNVYKNLGDGDLALGFDKLNQMEYDEARALVEFPVACIDCHNPETMELRITRPAFMEGIRKIKAAEGIKDYDVNRDATRQEMRSYVCGQCHVEYYFKGEEKRLTYPWDNGLRAPDMLEYYDKVGFSDWTHAITDTGVIKAQHPEFETWRQGIHAQAGVACADCHMPYKRVGAMKVSDHQVRSPLLDINASCQTCHRASEDELMTRAQNIQRRHVDIRNLAMDGLIDLIEAIEKAQDKDAISGNQIKNAQMHQRRAQFLLDFAEQENSTGFHADQELARTLAISLDESRRGMAALGDIKYGEPPGPYKSPLSQPDSAEELDAK
ncbi:MAG: ammonia-forming cytochrome c nitrite reductase subunit c552 [Candidatus Sumerlaeota bacterium]